MASTYPTSLDSFTNPTSTDLLTSPSHAQQHSDINDAMEAVQTKLAIGNTVVGTYTAYTPTMTNVTIGNGTFSTAYCRVNNFVHYYGIFTLGSTSAVTGTPLPSLPINSSTDFANNASMPYGTIMFNDVSTTQVFNGVLVSNVTATFAASRIANTASTYSVVTGLSSTIPFTWATGDKIMWNIYYRAA
jgi:hypothetical protein